MGKHSFAISPANAGIWLQGNKANFVARCRKAQELKISGSYPPASKKIVVMVEPRDKIDGKDFAMITSKGKKKKKKSMMGRYS